MKIVPASAADAGELLTLQLAAYVTEAQLYGDPYLTPLVETLDEVRAAVAAGRVLVAREDGRLVGSVRGVVDGDTCHVARLVVAPDVRRRGIATALVAAVEARDGARVRRFALFTGHRSEGNLRLYRALGYVATHAVPVDDGLSLVHMVKPAPAR